MHCLCQYKPCTRPAHTQTDITARSHALPLIDTSIISRRRRGGIYWASRLKAAVHCSFALESLPGFRPPPECNLSPSAQSRQGDTRGFLQGFLGLSHLLPRPPSYHKPKIFMERISSLSFEGNVCLLHCRRRRCFPRSRPPLPEILGV